MSEYGICIWNVIPVRTHPSDKEELCTQLLFGDAYEILETSKDKKWCKIRVHFDFYEGWIDTKQNHIVSARYYQKVIKEELRNVVQSIASKAIVEGKQVPLVQGSVLPILSGELFKIDDKDCFFMGKAGKQKKENISEKAMEYLGTPYLWGGKTHFGIDCSGFTQIVFKQCGIKIPRDAYQQANKGEIINFGNIEEGDLAFFNNTEGKITHVGIILSGKKIIHAHGEVRVDVLDEEGIFNEKKKYYSHNLSHITRII